MFESPAARKSASARNSRTRSNISPEFMKAYFEALATLDGAKPPAKLPGARKPFIGSLISIFGPLSSRAMRFTKDDKRGVLNRYCETVGDLAFAALRREDVEAKPR